MQDILQGFISRARLTYPDLQTFSVLSQHPTRIYHVLNPRKCVLLLLSHNCERGWAEGKKIISQRFFWSWTLILRRPVKKRVKTISVWKKLNNRREEQSKGRLLKNQNHSPISISSPYVVAKPHGTWQSRRATLVSPIMLYGKAFLPWSFCKWSLLLLSWPCCFMPRTLVGSLTAVDVLHCHSW